MKFSKLIQKYVDKFAQLFSVLSFVVIILLGIVLLIQIAKEIIRLFQITLEPITSDIYLMIDKIIVFFLLFEFFMIVISSLKNNGHVSITLLMGLGLTALLRNLLIIHDDYKNLILNIVGILLLIVGMAIYRYFVHAHIKEEDQQQK
ncbi:phosphate-starvation-inducible protein PsiE [Ligilactobacillus salivarius]